MPDLTFTVERAEVAPFAAAPLLLFKLHIASSATTATMAAAPASEAVKNLCGLSSSHSLGRRDDSMPNGIVHQFRNRVEA